MAIFRVFLIFGTMIVVLPAEVRPQAVFNQTCFLESGKDGFCVNAHLCRDNVINIHGAGLVDLRFSDDCENYLLKCCSVETPCEDNKGTCVATSRCDADFDSSRYRLFKESDECEWNDYKCCPNEMLRKSCVRGSGKCVPRNECKGTVHKDYDNECEGLVCCAGLDTNVIPASTSIPDTPGKGCVDNTGVCTPRKQCKGTVYRDRKNECGGLVCCATATSTASLLTTTTPRSSTGKSCFHNNGICTLREDCSGTVYTDRRNECEGLVCCASQGTAGSTTPRTFITSTTTREPVTFGKSCVSNTGVCTPRKQCKGTVYRDRNNECEGLVCCATATSTVSLPTNTTPRPTAGNSCFYNNGICTLREDCSGTVYTDRRNECEGLVCCASQGTVDSTTPRTFITSTTTQEPARIGKPCLDNSGKCTQRRDCKGTVYRDRKNECNGLVCCMTKIEPVRTCSSMKGTCATESSCLRKSTNSAVDCSADTVCCMEVEEEIKECGYRNEHGVKFNTVNRNDGESQYGEFPWMVAIMTENAGVLKYFCGGSLIHPEAVLTSAECLRKYRRTPNSLTIRAGEWDIGSVLEPIPYQERRVQKITFHNEFQPNTLLNNVALVFLESAFHIGSTVNTICLPPQNYHIDNGEVTGMGWGTTPQNRKLFQQILKSLDLPYVPKAYCEQTLRRATSNRMFKLHSSFICAGGMPGIDTCSGDGGSPIVHYIPDDLDNRYYAVGMVSWGVGCGRAGVPAAYTSIGAFREWIDREMEKENLEISYYEYQPKDTEES